MFCVKKGSTIQYKNFKNTKKFTTLSTVKVYLGLEEGGGVVSTLWHVPKRTALALALKQIVWS